MCNTAALCLALAQLRGAHLHGAQLHGAQIHGAQMHGAQLHGAQIHGAQLHGAQLHSAQFHGAQLHSAQLHGAQLHGAILQAVAVALYNPEGFRTFGQARLDVGRVLLEQMSDESYRELLVRSLSHDHSLCSHHLQFCHLPAMHARVQPPANGSMILSQHALDCISLLLLLFFPYEKAGIHWCGLQHKGASLQKSAEASFSPSRDCMYKLSTLPESSQQQLHTDVSAGSRQKGDKTGASDSCMIVTVCCSGGWHTLRAKYAICYIYVAYTTARWVSCTGSVRSSGLKCP